MGIGSWAVLAAVAAAAGLALRAIRRGKGGACCGDCEACARECGRKKS